VLPGLDASATQPGAALDYEHAECNRTGPPESTLSLVNSRKLA
jgi:hypothetical protein